MEVHQDILLNEKKVNQNIMIHFYKNELCAAMCIYANLWKSFQKNKHQTADSGSCVKGMDDRKDEDTSVF